MSIYLSILWLLICDTLVAGESIPPRGKRIYLLNKNDIFSPSIIISDQLSAQPSLLRDPLPPKGDILGGVKKTPVERVKPKPEGLVETGKIIFPSYGIKGALSRPRVSFESEYTNIGRADELPIIDIMARIRSTEAADTEAFLGIR